MPTRFITRILLLVLALAACNLPVADEPNEPLEEESNAGEAPAGSPTEADEAETNAAPKLAQVDSWLYILDVDLEQEVIEQIEASSYDLVVLDYIPSEENNTDFPMADVVDRIQHGEQPRLVLAYIDIGQAESYRTYWQPDWNIGDPEWIAGADPDGWAENYPVAFWYDEYQSIWLGAQGYLAGIIEAGFDGIYLDWVEAYSDESVREIAEAEGLDARQEMIYWVEDLASFGRARDPDFLVIAQNAAELVEDESYLAAIDGLAQEQIWFDGGADNEPPGDCPLPRLESLVDSQEYYDSLSMICQRQYDEFPESTLHVSSQEYLEQLAIAQDNGLVILTVDYALEPDNVAWVYAESRKHGFVPFVSSRQLDRFVPVD